MKLQDIISVVSQLNPAGFEKNMKTLLFLQNLRRTEMYNRVTPIEVLPVQCMDYSSQFQLSEWE